MQHGEFQYEVHNFTLAYREKYTIWSLKIMAWDAGVISK